MKLLFLSFTIQLVALSISPASGGSEKNSLDLSDFVPPAPKVQKRIPAVAVKASVQGQMENQKSLRIIRSAPSQLPDLKSIREEAKERSEVAEITNETPTNFATSDHQFIVLGATVIDHEISHVTWTDNSGKQMEALCGFDISLLEGVSDIRHGDISYSLMLMHGQHVTKRDGNFHSESFPQLNVKPGEILLPETAVKNGAEVPENLKIIGELIRLEKKHLAAFQKARAKRAEQERQWKIRNPEPPQDETIVLRPHTGSRYLQESQEASNAIGKGANQ